MSQYFMPTKVVSGLNCIIENSALLKTLGKKAIIVTGKNSAKINGSEADVISALNKEALDYVIYNQIEANPTIEACYEGAEFAKDNGADFVIAIGGGSPMDAAKGIALLAAQEIERDKLFSGVYEPKVLPMAFVPTTAGTGSEVTQYSILTNNTAQTKTSIATELIFPKIAFLDAKYTSTLSITTTINTAIDALSHSIEGMLTVRASHTSNLYAKESISMIATCLDTLAEANEKGTPLTIELREQLLHASMFAGVTIAQTGTTIVHGMGYSLTYFKDIDHGRANGLLLGSYLELVEQKNPERIKPILTALGMDSVATFKTWINRLLGTKEMITTADQQKYSDMAFATKNMNNCVVKPTREEIGMMYKQVFGEY